MPTDPTPDRHAWKRAKTGAAPLPYLRAGTVSDFTKSWFNLAAGARQAATYRAARRNAGKLLRRDALKLLGRV